MIYGLYNSAAGMLVNEYRQGVLANNIANADTIGFKRDIAVFAERVPASNAGRRNGPSDASLSGISGGLWLGRTHTDYAEGRKLQTGNNLDVSLDGPGFFAVQGAEQPLFTRDGRMIVNPDGLLISAVDGAPMLSRAGGPIYVNPHGSRDFTFDEDGRISQDGQIVGQLAVVDFEDYAALDKVAAQRFIAPEDSGFHAAGRVRSGTVEASGAEPIHELVNMIEASRAYQMNAQMVSLQDQSVGRLISTVMRT